MEVFARCCARFTQGSDSVSGAQERMEAPQLSVIDCFVELLQREKGEMSAARLPLLYQMHPAASQELKAAGGVKTFCALHSERIRFVKNAGAGVVQLVTTEGSQTAEPMTVAAARARGVLDEVLQVVKAAGGTIIAAQLPEKLTPEAREELKRAGGVKSFCAQHPDWLLFVGNEGGGMVKLGAASQAPSSVIDCLVMLLEKEGGEMTAARLPVLYQMHPAASQELKAAGGVKAFCAVHHHRIKFKTNAGAGMVQLVAAAEPAAAVGEQPAMPLPAAERFQAPCRFGARCSSKSCRYDHSADASAVPEARRGAVLDHVLQVLQAAGGALAAAQLPEKLSPEAREELKKAGGVKSFCAQHFKRLKFVTSAGVGTVKLRPAEEAALWVGPEKARGLCRWGASCTVRDCKFEHRGVAAGFEAAAGGGRGAALEQVLQVLGYEEEVMAAQLPTKLSAEARNGLRACGGVKAWCAMHPDHVVFAANGGGGVVRRAARAEGAGTVVEFLELLVERYGGELVASKLPALYLLHPGAREAVQAAGGAQGFCAQHPARLRFVVDASKPGGGCVTRVAGSVASSPKFICRFGHQCAVPGCPFEHPRLASQPPRTEQLAPPRALHSQRASDEEPMSFLPDRADGSLFTAPAGTPYALWGGVGQALRELGGGERSSGAERLWSVGGGMGGGAAAEAAGRSGVPGRFLSFLRDRGKPLAAQTSAVGPVPALTPDHGGADARWSLAGADGMGEGSPLAQDSVPDGLLSFLDDRGAPDGDAVEGLAPQTSVPGGLFSFLEESAGETRQTPLVAQHNPPRSSLVGVTDGGDDMPLDPLDQHAAGFALEPLLDDDELRQAVEPFAHASSLQFLTGSGFEMDSAKSALARCNGDVNDAVALLLDPNLSVAQAPPPVPAPAPAVAARATVAPSQPPALEAAKQRSHHAAAPLQPAPTPQPQPAQAAAPRPCQGRPNAEATAQVQAEKGKAAASTSTSRAAPEQQTPRSERSSSGTASTQPSGNRQHAGAAVKKLTAAQKHERVLAKKREITRQNKAMQTARQSAFAVWAAVWAAPHSALRRRLAAKHEGEAVAKAARRWMEWMKEPGQRERVLARREARREEEAEEAGRAQRERAEQQARVAQEREEEKRVKEERKARKQERRQKEREEEEARRLAFWEAEQTHEIRTCEVLVELCIAEFQRQLRSSGQAVQGGQAAEQGLRANQRAMNRLYSASSAAYRKLFQQRICRSVTLVGLKNADLDHRAGTIKAWDETKEKYVVRLETKKGHKEAKLLVKPCNLEPGPAKGGKPAAPAARARIQVDTLYLDRDFGMPVEAEELETALAARDLKALLAQMMAKRDAADRERKEEEEKERKVQEEVRRLREAAAAKAAQEWERREAHKREVRERMRQWEQREREYWQERQRENQPGRCNCPGCQFKSKVFGSGEYFFFAGGAGESGCGSRTNFAFEEEWCSDDEYSDDEGQDDGTEWEYWGGWGQRRDEGQRRAEAARREAEDAKHAAVLGLKATASREEIKRAYRSKALQFHPDKLKADSGMSLDQTTEQFRRIQFAYEHLMGS